jgi:large subunit ribosomal protein L4
MDVPLITASGETKGKVALPAALVGDDGSLRILQEVLVAYRRNQRRGTSDTKTRAEVSGGGHKPWKQKGTGNARSGSNRSPLWRKGGIVFGPHPRSYRTDVGGVKRRVAFATAFQQIVKSESLSVIDSFPEGEGKTGPAGKFLAKAAPQGRVLLVVDKKTDLLIRAIRNLPRLTITDAKSLNPWDLMWTQKVLITKPALQVLESRFPQG